MKINYPEIIHLLLLIKFLPHLLNLEIGLDLPFHLLLYVFAFYYVEFHHSEVAIQKRHVCIPRSLSFQGDAIQGHPS